SVSWDYSSAVFAIATVPGQTWETSFFFKSFDDDGAEEFGKLRPSQETAREADGGLPAHRSYLKKGSEPLDASLNPGKTEAGDPFADSFYASLV
ncbi:MAG: hypothetical protein O3A00_22550, partial [Planctomycetota bacterium]|nr:hypothetical protein [Planctomycetota bacterium]